MYLDHVCCRIIYCISNRTANEIKRN